MTSALAERPPVVVGGARRTWRGRVAAAGLGAAAGLLQRLPDRGLHRLAHAVGGLLYRAQPERRALVRANLRRVCRWLAEEGLARPDVARAAIDEAALERLVRDAFGHYLRSYLEGAIVGRYGGVDGARRVTADDSRLADELLGPAGGGGRAAIVVGLHLGAIEIAGLQATARGARMMSPMETVSDPDLQAYLHRARSSSGLEIVPVRGAGRRLAEWLGNGRPVALVADRAVEGGGVRVTLFGEPARLPIGPAVLALESGAPVYVVAARRTGYGEYRVRIERLQTPDAALPRRRWLAEFMAAEARLFERVVADAPEQWWTLFFPIWGSPS